MSASWYDPISERWHKMPADPPIERPKPRTPEGDKQEQDAQRLRIAKHSFLWQAIEATATATQMSQPSPEEPDPAI